MLCRAALLHPAGSYSPLTCTFLVMQNLALTCTLEGGPLMHFCFITCPFQFASSQLRCEAKLSCTACQQYCVIADN